MRCGCHDLKPDNNNNGIDASEFAFVSIVLVAWRHQGQQKRLEVDGDVIAHTVNDEK